VWFGANAPAQEQAEQSHLNTKEGGGLARRQDHQQHGEVSAEASNEECRLGRSVPQRLSAHDRLDARHVQREPLQQQEREEEIALPPGQPTGETAPALRCRRCERERTGSQVGVCALLVRVGVVTVVLSQPPAIAQPSEEPRDHPRGPFVPAVRGEDLVVCGIVSRKPNWASTTANAAASMSWNHELPRSTKTTQIATNAAISPMILNQ